MAKFFGGSFYSNSLYKTGHFAGTGTAPAVGERYWFGTFFKPSLYATDFFRGTTITPVVAETPSGVSRRQDQQLLRQQWEEFFEKEDEALILRIKDFDSL